MNKRVSQARTDALAAEYIYTKKLKGIEALSLTINCLTILVPILFSAAVLLAKGTAYESCINVVSVVLSAVLLALSAFSMLIGIDKKRENYLIARRSNAYVSSEALKILDVDESQLSWFYNYLVEMDSRDQENLGDVSDKLKKEAYRYSLKKLIPGDASVVCSVCNASPFSFKKGNCQVCGNTPKG